MWYFQKKGRTEGPIPEATLHLAIQKGEIGALDLLFHEGDSRWRAAYEYDALQKFFQAKVGSASEDHWIILSRSKDKDNKQRGPYRTSEVRSKLQSGEVKYTDYAWKQGMKEWYRITALEIFHGEARPVVKDDLISQAPELPPEELYQKVEVLERKPIPQPEEKPKDALGPDLAKVVATPVAKKSTAKPVGIKAPRPQVYNDEVTKTNVPVSGRRLSVWDRFQEASPSTKWMVGLVCVFVALAIALGSLFTSSYQDHLSLLAKTALKKTISEPEPEIVPAPEIQKPPEAAVAEKVPPPMPAQPEKPRVEPSYLKLKVSENGGDAPIAELQTDASLHYPIKLTVIGEIGEVIGSRGYYRQVVITDPEKRKFELRLLGLRPGQYRLQAVLQTFDAKADLSVGTNTKTYRADLSEHRKQISYFATNERIQLVKLSERLDDHNQDFIAQMRLSSLDTNGMKTFFKKWQKKLETISSQTLKSVNARNRGQFVFGEYWIELKELRTEMLKTSAKAVQGKTMTTPEWQDYMKVVQGVKSMKEKMLGASLFR